MAALESELFNLHVRHQPKFVPTIKTRTQRKAEQNNRIDEEEEEIEMRRDIGKEKVARNQKGPVPPRSNSPVEEPVIQQPTNVEEPQSRVPVLIMPEHPFRQAKDATYAPSKVRNTGAPIKPAQPNVKKPEVAYRTLPAIHDPSIANKVYNRALESSLSITYHELLSLSPEVRSQVRDATSSRRIPLKEGANATHATLLQEETLTEGELALLFDDEEYASYSTQIGPTIDKSSINKPLPSNATIIDDPIDNYYRNLGEGELPDPDRLIVAKESSALRSIIPLVDNQLKVEAILDPGCQIIAMSEDVCHELALPYDPTIVLNMQSANGAVDPSLGLARNVPFLIGTLTFYMQVHVIRGPAYDILLGRPFDVLTESVVRNFRNEDQTITVHDPNTNQVATIPTVCRGPPKILTKKKAVFRE
jgi:hypothetical protein